ncbi:MAG: hypothetical protein HUU28_16240 [Planctomycetaceae bacterium]|jgi:hypothetical protein|nr:hypothetical protein [Planctomycetaceae bacterium]
MRRLTALLLVVACGCKESQEVSIEAAAPESAASEAPTGRVEAPSGSATAKPAESEARPAPKTELTFRVPDEWEALVPKVPLRKFELRVPRVEGDTQDAELLVLHRGPVGMGPLEAQWTRWSQQFTQPDGSNSRERLKLSNSKIGGRAVNEAELEGTCVAEKGPESGERWNEPGWKLLGAVIESEFGPYYVRLLGPKATVEANAARFRAFLESTAQ